MRFVLVMAALALGFSLSLASSKASAGIDCRPGMGNCPTGNGHGGFGGGHGMPPSGGR